MQPVLFRSLALGFCVSGFSVFSGLAVAQEANDQPAAEAAQDQPAPAGKQVGPDPIPAFQLSQLRTVPVRREAPGPNWIVADASPLPKDPEGIWVFEFAYKPVRIIEIELPGKGRRRVHYLYYRVVNRTGETRRFVPQFTLIAHNGKGRGSDAVRYEDAVLPLAAKKIQAKEDPTHDLSGAVTVMGELPASTKQGIDDAFYGVAIWDNVDFSADAFEVYVRGLSNAYQVVEPAAGSNEEPLTRYKALRLDFTRYGDDRSPHSKEVRTCEPAYEWTYFP